MSTNLIWIVLVAAGIPGGMVAGYFLRKSWATREAESAESKAQHLLEEAKTKQRELLVDAKGQALKIIEEAKREDNTRRNEVSRIQDRLEKREALFDQKLLELENRQSDVQKQA